MSTDQDAGLPREALGDPTGIPTEADESDAGLNRAGSRLVMPDSMLHEHYRLMYTIRSFEQRVERSHQEGSLYGPFHSSMGQEAVSVGVCGELRPDDVIVSTHRGHGHVIAKGIDIDRLCAELWGKATGYCGGKGGSMHVASVDHGIICQNPIIGGSEFLAAGAALAFQQAGSERFAVAFCGDGAVGQGVFHETLNFAGMWKLPVVFVVENNGFAHSFRSDRMPVGEDIAGLAAGYGIPGVCVDGTDVLAVAAATQAAVKRGRAGHGPSLIEARCYRWRGHNLGDADHLYREKDEVERERKNDPLLKFREAQTAVLTDEAIGQIERSVDDQIDKAIEFAESSPLPDRGRALEDSF
ncbi:MAG: thiamine pyrophosphate-dependent dehydrogenase E1 component subunit alpha [Acidimicrobiales bacterium]|nr:thiamine pyrophosphate-dependent dehydrogenase E1 component subunit alpha [Acidimicrobiales bacterium]